MRVRALQMGGSGQTAASPVSTDADFATLLVALVGDPGQAAAPFSAAPTTGKQPVEALEPGIDAEIPDATVPVLVDDQPLSQLAISITGGQTLLPDVAAAVAHLGNTKPTMPENATPVIPDDMLSKVEDSAGTAGADCVGFDNSGMSGILMSDAEPDLVSDAELDMVSDAEPDFVDGETRAGTPPADDGELSESETESAAAVIIPPAVNVPAGRGAVRMGNGSGRRTADSSSVPEQDAARRGEHTRSLPEADRKLLSHPNTTSEHETGTTDSPRDFRTVYRVSTAHRDGRVDRTSGVDQVAGANQTDDGSRTQFEVSAVDGGSPEAGDATGSTAGAALNSGNPAATAEQNYIVEYTIVDNTGADGRVTIPRRTPASASPGATGAPAGSNESPGTGGIEDSAAPPTALPVPPDSPSAERTGRIERFIGASYSPDRAALNEVEAKVADSMPPNSGLPSSGSAPAGMTGDVSPLSTGGGIDAHRVYRTADVGTVPIDSTPSADNGRVRSFNPTLQEVPRVGNGFRIIHTGNTKPAEVRVTAEADRMPDTYVAVAGTASEATAAADAAAVNVAQVRGETAVGTMMVKPPPDTTAVTAHTVLNATESGIEIPSAADADSPPDATRPVKPAIAIFMRDAASAAEVRMVAPAAAEAEWSPAAASTPAPNTYAAGQADGPVVNATGTIPSGETEPQSADMPLVRIDARRPQPAAEPGRPTVRTGEYTTVSHDDPAPGTSLQADRPAVRATTAVTTEPAARIHTPIVAENTPDGTTVSPKSHNDTPNPSAAKPAGSSADTAVLNGEAAAVKTAVPTGGSGTDQAGTDDPANSKPAHETRSATLRPVSVDTRSMPGGGSGHRERHSHHRDTGGSPVTLSRPAAGPVNTTVTGDGTASNAATGQATAVNEPAFEIPLAAHDPAAPNGGIEPAVDAGESVAGTSSSMPAADAQRSGAAARPVAQATLAWERRAEIIETVVRHAALMSLNGRSSAVLHLEPPALGRIKLEIVTERSRVTGLITVDRSEVRDVIVNRMAELHDSLARHGLRVESFDVQVGQNDGGDAWAQRERFFRPDRWQGHPARPEYGGHGTSEAVSLPGMVRSRAVHVGSLDVVG